MRIPKDENYYGGSAAKFKMRRMLASMIDSGVLADTGLPPEKRVAASLQIVKQMDEQGILDRVRTKPYVEMYEALAACGVRL